MVRDLIDVASAKRDYTDFHENIAINGTECCL